MVVGCSLPGPTSAQDQTADFRVLPYVQAPTETAITISWFSHTDTPGKLMVTTSEEPSGWTTTPVRAEALAHNPWKAEPGGPHPALPYLHRVRIERLNPATKYSYFVTQGTSEFAGEFRTAAGPDDPIRFLVYSDSETEPESTTSPPVDWPAPPNSGRPAGMTKYLVDQTTGYRENCRVMLERQPHFILVTGDLVETGGEQRDWDEFWRHNAGDYGRVASSIPLFPALGNHENFAGPGGGYSAEGANFGVAKYLTYFAVPANGATKPEHIGRYYRIDYGPVAVLTVDSSDGLPHKTAQDTNHNLEGSHAPDFHPGSEQYQWLEAQLADAQRTKRFTIVQFHHTMYGSGPHSVPFGQPGFSGQSGIAMRVLEPLFFKYGVDVVFSGHDEMLERSVITGEEVQPDGTRRTIHIPCYDVGMGGDGLRGPVEGFDNPHRKFLAHLDAPEVWEGQRLVSGGKHYGHVEVNVAPSDAGEWRMQILPVAVFPVTNAEGGVTGWERRPYDDGITVPLSAP